jgi:hypothetical protein
VLKGCPRAARALVELKASTEYGIIVLYRYEE